MENALTFNIMEDCVKAVLRCLKDRGDLDTWRWTEKHFKMESLWGSLEYTEDRLEISKLKKKKEGFWEINLESYTIESLECQAEKFGLWPIANEGLLSFMN